MGFVGTSLEKCALYETHPFVDVLTEHILLWGEVKKNGFCRDIPREMCSSRNIFF